MSSQPYDSDYPVHIDLGQKVPDYGSAIAGPEKTKKTKISYPTLYIDGGSDLSKLQKDGWALIKYHRKKIALGEDSGLGPAMAGSEGKDQASATLEVRELCLPEESGDLMDEFKAFAKSKGVSTGSADSEPDGEPEEDDEEN
jgi:hypothetical protein